MFGNVLMLWGRFVRSRFAGVYVTLGRFHFHRILAYVTLRTLASGYVYLRRLQIKYLNVFLNWLPEINERATNFVLYDLFVISRMFLLDSDIKLLWSY